MSERPTDSGSRAGRGDSGRAGSRPASDTRRRSADGGIGRTPGGHSRGSLGGEAPTGDRPGARRRARWRTALLEVGYLLGLLATAGAVYWALVLLPSQLKTRALREHRDALEREVTGAEERIARLEAEARALEEDPWLIERALRRRFGYLRPGELAVPTGAGG